MTTRTDVSKAALSRPSMRTLDTLDAAPRLSGQLAPGGIASLDVDQELSRKSSSESVYANGDVPTPASNASNGRGDYFSESDVEDYDRKKPEPDAMRQETASTTTIIPTANGFSSAKRNSIPIRLEKTDKRGRYMLKADDEEFTNLLRDGIERQKTGASSAPAQRHAVRDLVFTRRFSTFDRLNPSNNESPFFGFFTLFWLGMALMLVQIAAKNYRTYGSVLGKNEAFQLMFSRDLLVLGLTDGVLWLSTSFGVLLSKACAAGWLHWGRSGYIIENVWQACYLFAAIGWTFYRDWPWTHTIFIVLHTLVFVMKQHSYAFYNGYLSQVYHRRKLLERKLDELQAIDPIDSTTAPPSPEIKITSSSGNGVPLSPQRSPDTTLRQRRKRSLDDKSPAPASNLAKDPEDIAAIAQAISSHEPLTEEQLSAFTSVIRDEIHALSTELRGKCKVTKNYYPNNLSFSNFLEWTCLPTLVYELEYPRQATVNWLYVAEKTAATFGTLLVMIILSQAYIYPSVRATVEMKESGMSISERWREFPWIVLDMLFPLLLEQLLTWYVIWECVLNVLAEIFRFADRGFYGAWWNSTSWDQYARDWNRPVHNFLLRHVYSSSISAFHLKKTQATFATFLLSALVHELLMFCMFKKVRGYLFSMQLLQMPLVMVSRTGFLKNKKVLGNTVFWIGLFVGPSFLTSLYLVV
ncbi:MAG: hypothetical protein Q9159_006140 [Coniocarpon cinnabarinum]